MGGSRVASAHTADPHPLNPPPPPHTHTLQEALVQAKFNPLSATSATAAQVVALLKAQWNVTTAVTCAKGCVLCGGGVGGWRCGCACWWAGWGAAAFGLGGGG